MPADYTITFRKGAAKAYLGAVAWYKGKSVLAAENFVKAVNEMLDRIVS